MIRDKSQACRQELGFLIGDAGVDRLRDTMRTAPDWEDVVCWIHCELGPSLDGVWLSEMMKKHNRDDRPGDLAGLDDCDLLAVIRPFVISNG